MDICGYAAEGYQKINCRISPWIKAGYKWICNGYPLISKKYIISYPTIYPLICTKDILEISWCLDISGYLRISQDMSGYRFGANSQLNGSQDGLQLQREGVRLHFGVYFHHCSLVLECLCNHAVLEIESTMRACRCDLYYFVFYTTKYIP